MTQQTAGQSEFIPNIGYPPIQDLVLDKSASGTDVNHRNWVNWFNSISNLVNSAEYYGNPSEALNSDFYWQAGVATPITQASGDGAFFAEKWQIHGAGVATYTITSTQYAAASSDQIGSIYYENFDITNYAGDGSTSDFYAYQQTQLLPAFLRRFQARIMTMSAIITNTLTTNVTVRFEVYFFFNGSAAVSYKGNNFSLPTGVNEVSDQITTEPLTGKTIGAAPYVQFRLVFCDLEGDAANINVGYIKVEVADQVSILYVDHALERTRIDNS